ncbi:hypothetical protein EUGRSUZ_H01432 [Eucalyptus grandis]|uniref:Uncharacterized protein n=2 Tax=Eucalyptus grandis TaxID=71139 RepID=A0ACC3JP13_EUCGR|nr:hypothetical protein EUGRSUZ_H01432 [Eucalyptus grandis]
MAFKKEANNKNLQNHTKAAASTYARGSVTQNRKNSRSRENRDQGITWMWINATAAARRRNHRKSQRNLLTIVSPEPAGETAVAAEDHAAKASRAPNMADLARGA